MARKTAAKPLTRLQATDPAMLAMSKVELLLHPDARAAADELYRREHNKLVKKQQQA